MIVCIKRLNATKLVEADEFDFDHKSGGVKLGHRDWDEAELVYTKDHPDTTVLVLGSTGELIMRIDENGGKLLKGNLINTKGE